jgi:SPP1 gp7 family putative phage head morphogenesis protein
VIRRPRLPRQQQPDLIRDTYFAALRAQPLRMMRSLATNALTPRLPSWVEERARLDAYGKEARQLLETTARDFVAEFDDARLENLAQTFATSTSGFQRIQLQRQIRTAIGVELPIRDSQLGPRIEKFTNENVALIRSMSSDFFGDLSKQVIRAVDQGMRTDELSDLIEDRYGVAESRAQLIARDQIGKLFGDLNQARQQDLGVESYVWRTMNDERVRDEHVELEGETFSWDEEPPDGHPGDAINCRCFAEPDLSDLTS